MEIRGKRILVLGGWGLVGLAICRELLKHSPAKLVISSLRSSEAKEAVEQLLKDFPEVSPEILEARWGNIFSRTEWKDMDWNEVLSNAIWRKQIVSDIYDDLTNEILENSALYSLINETKPDIVIDCINTATAFAYQDIYKGVNSVRAEIMNGNLQVEDVERLIASIYIPQLIRHIQILYRALVDSETKMYLKIGTSGTGGMGLNIPYTHSEERPSRVLLAKSAVAGAQTLLLYLMARSPNGPIIKEIKPTAVIAWKKIDYGEVYRKGKPIQLVDMPVEKAKSIGGKFKFSDFEGIIELNDNFRSVYIDTGENGIFSRAEFEAISALGQMEVVTPEEIALYSIFEILGGNTGKDVIQGLDAFTLGPTYRGGFLQHYALKMLRRLEEKMQIESIAFELLGPPRLSKLLFEANLIKRVAGTLKKVLLLTPEELSLRSFEIIKENVNLRSEMLSIGLVILLPDGKTYLRGKEVKIPVQNFSGEWDFNDENLEKWCYEGWVDLRPQNFQKWQFRIQQIISQVESQGKDDTSSCYNYSNEYWNYFNEINEGKLIAWIFENEDKGWRFKR
ncbi:MAG: short-chain dehydrogenase [Ignavibacteria bacterium]|nr:short-chain dehydrogenase [Ignavibacteria bacterium]